MARSTKTAICTRCSKRQEVDQFYKDKSTKAGHSPWCKSCEREYNRTYRAKLKEAAVNKQAAAKPRSRKRTAKAA